MQIKPVITFIFPNYLNGNLDYHLGANYIIAFLRTKGIYAEQLVIKKRLGLVELTDLILERQSKIIGFTSFTANHHLIKLLSREIRLKRPDVLIIAGGPAATFSDKGLLRDIPEIDMCIRGEGEYTVFELVEHLNSNEALGSIEGITYRKEEKIIRNPDRPFIKNTQDRSGELDIMPSPYLTGVLNPEDLLNQNGDISILTSRGCVYRCTYCNFSIMSRHTIRYYSIDRIIAELKAIEKLKKTGKQFKVMMLDDTFTFNKKRIKELCERIIKEGIRLDFWAATRGDCLDKKLLRLLFKAGIRELDFGLESAVPRILYAMKKARTTYDEKRGFIPEKRYIQSTKDNVEFAKKIGIKVGVNTMFGFPGETFKDGLKTLDFVDRLDVDGYHHNPLWVFPGTELFEAVSSSTFVSSRKSSKKKQYATFQKYPIFLGYFYSEYDFTKLPLLHNEIFLSLRKNLLSFFLANALTGIFKKINFNHSEHIVLIGDFFPFKWFEKNLALQTRVIFGKNTKKLINHKKGAVKFTVKSFTEMLPLVLRRDLVFYKIRDEIICPNKNCSFLKPAQLNKLSAKLDNAAITLKISDNKDIDELEKIVNSAKLDRKVLQDCIILDSCRWSSNCPASPMKRLVIDDNGDIRTCFQGEVLGNIDMPLKDIQRKVPTLIKKIEAERGCNLCSAKDRCSRCVFLGSIAPDKYCSIMKNRFTINRFVNSLSLARSMEQLIDIRKKLRVSHNIICP